MKKFTNCALLFIICFTNLTMAETHVQIGCAIYNLEKKLIRQHPGQFCLFFDDGSFLASFNSEIKMYNSNLSVLWKQSILAHHQLNSSNDKSEILLIGSENIQMTSKHKHKETVRSDILYVVNRDGKIQKKFSLYENRNQFKNPNWKNAEDRKFNAFLPQDKKRFNTVDWEITHTNSFYEIDSKFKLKNPQFKNAHYIVNDISLMLVFFLDKELKTVVWQSPILSEKWTMFHDVQTLENGYLLFYDNGTKDRPITKLIEFDLINNKIVRESFGSNKKQSYSPYWGGIQKLINKNFFYTEIATDLLAKEIDEEDNLVWEMKLPSNTYLQQAKKINLTLFLNNNKGI